MSEKSADIVPTEKQGLAKLERDSQQSGCCECCERNCGPNTMAFKIRVQIQQVGEKIIEM